jgi:hypothetical protein
VIALAGAQPVPKDVVTAALGASAALSGLMLVFLGMLLPASGSAERAYLSAVDASMKRRDDAAAARAEGDDRAAEYLDSEEESYSPRTLLMLKTWKRVDRAGNVVVVALLLGLADIALSMAWLALPGGHGLYIVSIWLFALELVAIVAVVFFATPALSRLT